MRYTNSKYLDFSQGGSLEFHPCKEVAEEVECTTIMVEKQGPQRSCCSTSSFLGRSLTSGFIAAPLAILSMLKGAEGHYSRYQCMALSSACRIINLEKNSLNSTTRTGYIVFDKNPITNTSRVLVRTLNKESGIYTDDWKIELDMTLGGAEGNHSRLARLELARKLYHAYNYVARMPSKFGVNTRSRDFTLCDAECFFNICRDRYTGMRILDEFCPKIYSLIEGARNYLPATTTSTTLKYGVMNSTTVVPDIVDSTTAASDVLNSTSTKSTTLRTTEITPIDKDLNIFVVVLVALLSLAVALLAFPGYKRCSKKTDQQQQTVLQSTNAVEEVDDLF
ncbi:hypothetical protein [Candidatus Ichthyocystis hellenicum]|uniref:hypothetical protein n=1 Tax=Candidatus Ichthyocystis hellenicum TaxID=1561003 RepID=UPI000B8779D4|nr:hypothetical protein [Candidatus Ichthyocystis hellenicum]